MPNNQLELLDDDKRCSADKEDGSKCGGFHITDSPYCSFHSGRLKESQEKRKLAVAKQVALVEEFEFDYFPTKTRKDVQALTEKVINGVIKGTLKRDKAALLSTYLPFAYKIAKELESSGGSGGVSLRITEKSQSISLQMDEAMMDRYLNGNESVKVEMLASMETEGKLLLTKNNDVIDVAATINPDSVKVPAKGIAAISEHTDLPMTPTQVSKLFGKTLGEAATMKKNPKGPDMVGFGHVFELGGRPEKSDPVKHKWKGKYEPEAKTGMAKLWFTCEHCGRREPNVVEEICPKAN